MVRMLLLIAVLPLSFLYAADTVASSQAKDHVGETVTVCGKVADTRYLDSSGVTFLNFDQPFPNHTFTAFLPADSRAKFGTPEKDYKDKNVCVTGSIQNFQGKPEIVLSDPAQIKLQEK